MKKISILSFILVLVFSVIALSKMRDEQKALNQDSLEKAIQNALTLCYAQEGFYPAKLDYLVENYGIVIDEDFVVTYKGFAANLRPVVHIYRIGGQP